MTLLRHLLNEDPVICLPIFIVNFHTFHPSHTHTPYETNLERFTPIMSIIHNTFQMQLNKKIKISGMYFSCSFFILLNDSVILTQRHLHDGRAPAEAGSRLESTHHGNQKFLDFVNSSLHLHGSSVLRVLHCDQDMQLVIQVFPVRLPSVKLFLRPNKHQCYRKNKSKANCTILFNILKHPLP